MRNAEWWYKRGMKWKRALALGALLWATVLLISFLIFPVKKTTPALFDSLIAVVLAACTVVYLGMYFLPSAAPSRTEGINLGGLWMAMSLVLDLPLFAAGPMKMTPEQYLADIGATYIMIPVITTGTVYLMRRSRAELESAIASLAATVADTAKSR